MTPLASQTGPQGLPGAACRGIAVLRPEEELALLEQDLKIRLNIHEAAIVDVLQRVMKILDPPPPPLEPPTPETGFHVKEDPLPYRIRRRAERTR